MFLCSNKSAAFFSASKHLVSHALTSILHLDAFAFNSVFIADISRLASSLSISNASLALSIALHFFSFISKAYVASLFSRFDTSQRALTTLNSSSYASRTFLASAHIFCSSFVFSNDNSFDASIPIDIASSFEVDTL